MSFINRLCTCCFRPPRVEDDPREEDLAKPTPSPREAWSDTHSSDLSTPPPPKKGSFAEILRTSPTFVEIRRTDGGIWIKRDGESPTGWLGSRDMRNWDVYTPPPEIFVSRMA